MDENAVCFNASVSSTRDTEGATITLVTEKDKRDRYARYIAEVIHEGINLSDYLLDIGAVKPLRLQKSLLSSVPHALRNLWSNLSHTFLIMA